MSSPSSAPLRIDVLGAAVVTVDGRPLDVDTRKAVALLAVLAVRLSEGRPDVPRTELAGLLWPDADTPRARGALRRTLSVLLAAVGDSVHTDRATVGAVPGRVVSDVVAFRELARSSDAEDLARAVGLVRGELLAGFVLRDSPAFDDWTAQTSDTLRRELGAVQERLVLARLRRGELHAALADTARWLELDPLHEPAHRSMLRLLAWTGRRQDALDHYHRTVRVLGDELGVAPVRATTEVYEAIRAGTLPPPRSPARTAPARPVPVAGGRPPLVGRAAALAALTAAVGDGGRVVVVTGEAGVGRTRLIEEFRATTPGVVVARAHGGETASSFGPVADLLREAVALGAPLPPALAVEASRLVPSVLPPDVPPAPALTSPGARDRFLDAVVEVLAGSGAAALVVEDVHAVGPASAEVLAYVVHRQERLGRPLVLTWRIPGLPARHPVQVAIAGGRHRDRVVPVRLDRLTRAEVATLVAGHDLDADDVWRDTAGLPLLVDGALRSGGADLPMTVRELLAARLAEVSEETAQVLGALAVHGGVADPDDLRGTSGRSEVETVDAVEEALRVGLVREEGAAVAFTHDVLRRVAYEQLSLVRRRLLHARAAETLAGHAEPDVRPAAIATHFHLGGRDASAVTWARAAATRFRELYAHTDALHQLEFAASLGRDDADDALAMGDVLVALARYEPARAAYDRALALLPSPASPSPPPSSSSPSSSPLSSPSSAPLSSPLSSSSFSRADVERRMADVAVRLGEWDRAAVGLDAALELVDRDTPLAARLLADRAVVALRAGSLDAAGGFVASALAVRPPDAYVDDVAGIVALAQGDVDDAVACFRSALASLGAGVVDPDPPLQAAVLNNLARAQASAGLPDAAVATAREALDLGRRLGDRHRLAALHANLADRLHELGAADDAMDHLKQAATLFAEVGADPLDRPDVWTLVAW